MSVIKKWTGKALGNITRGVIDVFTGGIGETGLSQKAGRETANGIDTLTGQRHDEKKKADELEAADRAEKAAKAAADQDYYNQIARQQERQAAALVASRTDFSMEDGMLGNYGGTLGSFGKRKKAYY